MTLDLGAALDPSTFAPSGGRVSLDAADLTRHAVVLGMTGSGKTGLGVALVEALAARGVPVLAVDPKGDLANLALALDPSRPAELAPWVDPQEAARLGVSVEALAERTARSWGEALAAEGIGAAALALRASHDVVVMTPGSEAGVPLDVLSALAPPAGLAEDPEGLREYVTGTASALLGLIGHDSPGPADPARLLLERVLGDAFARGEHLPLDVLLPRLVEPPFDVLGWFPLEEVIGREARQALAVALNTVAASPSFAPWMTGEPLDVAAWLAPAERTKIRILTLAHLDDRQRQFCVTLVLHAVVAWSRRQPGTGALRAVLWFDEVAGYLPPHPKDPPTKAPVLTLMKQARAVGLGVVLGTQNPVDVDYKALSNAGTWLAGRLQTRQDRARLAEGLGDVDGDLLARLPKRAFVLRGVEGPARVLRSRTAMSFLRGPLTRREIAALGQQWRRAAPADGLLGAAPALPEGVAVRWLEAAGAAALGLGTEGPWVPTVYGRLRVRLRGVEVSEDRVVHRWGWAGEATTRAVALQDAWLAKAAPPGDRRRYRPVGSDLLGVEVRDAWLEEVVAREVLEAAGEVVRPERRDVGLIAWAVVWAPGGASK